MDINRNNYEMYVVDFIEGNLSPDMEQQMRKFLSENPDIAEQIEGIEEYAVEPDYNNSGDWSHLMKTGFDDDEVFEELCIASIEHENSPDVEKQLGEYLESHPEKLHDYQLFQNTILKPDAAIQYLGKEALMKKSFKIPPIIYMAASVISIAIILFVSGNKSKVPASLLAQVEPFRVELETPVLKVQKKEYAKISVVQQLNEKIFNSQNIVQTSNREEININQMASVQVAVNYENIETVSALAEMPVQSLYSGTIEDNNELLASNQEQSFAGNLKSVLAEKGLSFLKQLSNDRLDYSSNADGKIMRVGYSSKLLAISIPVKSK